MKRTPVINIARYEDPLSKALLPPPNETPSEREKRIQAQCEAIRISKEIDESLLESKKVLESRKKATKVLLLGKSYCTSPSPHESNCLLQVRRKAESLPLSKVSNIQLPLSSANFMSDRFPALLLPGTISTREDSVEDDHSIESN